MVHLSEIGKSVIKGDISGTIANIEKALAKGITPNNILDKGLTPGINEVGDLFAKGELYFPELIMAGEVMKAAIERLRPDLTKGNLPSVGKYVIGTVKDDVHDIGKNIVIMFLQANGWEVSDLGVDQSPEKFCEAVKGGNFDILGLSTLLTMTMPRVEETMKALEDAGLRHKVKVMVGGVCVNQEWADKIGADAYGKDAVDAVRKANKLMDRSKGEK